MNSTRLIHAAVVTAAFTCGGVTFAQANAKADDHGGHHGASVAPTAAAAAQAEGEVRRINKEINKITLRHGELKALEMPPMTMVFTVRDPALLDRVKVGDKVRFRAEKTDGVFYVTEIELAK